MRRRPTRAGQAGFTLIELLAAMGIFLLVCGAAFTLLGSSQQRYRAESQVMSSFQEARLGLDQMVRDVNDSGYPPPSFNDGVAGDYASTPFAWSPNYLVPTPCTLGGSGTCTTPGDFDLIIETNPNPQDGGPVQWIRYQLQGPPAVPVPTLMRGMAPKTAGTDPTAAFTGANALAPFVQNVVNNAAQPIFSYTCDTPTAPQPQPPPCSSAGADNAPANIREVTITLVVAAPVPDVTTGQQHLVQLIGRGRRVNPNK
jgi:prepilin-type N-terminal cleavage/methylation domain-containing protein